MFVVLLCFTSIKQIAYALLYFSVSIGFRLYFSRLLFHYSSCESIIFFFVLHLFLLLNRLRLFRTRLFFKGRLLFFDFLFRKKVFIICCFDITILPLKSTGLQIILDLFLLVGMYFRRHLLDSRACTYTDTHYFECLIYKMEIFYQIED